MLPKTKIRPNVAGARHGLANVCGVRGVTDALVEWLKAESGVVCVKTL
jgi:hypothetical protein